MARNIVIIGGVALGTKAACRFKRLEPEANVILVDQDDVISYGGCGIPFYVSGDVSDISELRTTSFHMVRDEKFFRDVKGFEVRTSTRAVAVNRENKTVLVEYRDGTSEELPYDKLVFGTGSSPRNLGIKGQELDNIHSVANLHDAEKIKSMIVRGEVENAVIVGAGFIGLEMAEALTDMWGIETKVVEFCDQIMPGFVSKGLAEMASHHMTEMGVEFFLNESVQEFMGEDGAVKEVRTNKRTLPADLVIMAVGIQPRSELAKAAGLEIGPMGGILVNERMETSDPDIYAGGDCAEVPHLIAGQTGFFPLGSLANRQGRVIGTNMAGGNATLEGAVGSFVVRLFESSLAGGGLTLERARKAGYDAVSVQMCQLDRAHFYPEKDLMFLELVVEKETRRVLGIQGFGSSGDAMVGRINAVAGMLKFKPTVDDISNLELAYSPPFSSAMDVVNALGNVADNFLNQIFDGIDVAQFRKYWQEKADEGLFFLDCRALPDAKPFMEKYPEHWHNIPQDELKRRIDEVPRDKKIVLICNTGVRSFEAQLNLRELGFENNVSVQGGMAFVKKWGMDI